MERRETDNEGTAEGTGKVLGLAADDGFVGWKCVASHDNLKVRVFGIEKKIAGGFRSVVTLQSFDFVFARF